MKRTFALALLMCLTASLASAQESDNGKRLWANSILNQKAPALVVEKWLTDTPDTKGKFVLIDFWATWCGPCREFIPVLNEISQKHKDDLVVIGLSDETAEKVEAMKTPKPVYFEAIDTQKTMSKELDVKGIPHVILIDPKGIVRWKAFPCWISIN